jgi:5'(3')-deoxyribonucleotidase
MKKIAIDLDSTTWYLMGIFIPLYNKVYNENVKESDIDKWDYFPQDRFNVIYHKTVKRLKKYKPIDKHIGDYINRLSRYYKIFFLTHGKYTYRQIKKKLKTWGIIKGISYQDIIIDLSCNPKVKYDFDYFIDDNPCMIQEIQEFPNKTLLLFSNAWNESSQNNGYKNVFTFQNWKQILEFLERFIYFWDQK